LFFVVLVKLGLVAELVEYALMIGQPKPMVITEHVVVPIGMVETLVNAG